MACIDFQTECLRVVTIAYLKNFIGSEVQNSANGSPMYISSTYRDDYCPTYSELIGGSVIQTWVQGATPNGDRDGIIVNSVSLATGVAYAPNQLVDQKDLSMMYTRFYSFSVSSASGDISQCGGSKQLGYSHVYTRYTKSMNNSCMVSTTSYNVSDTADNEVSWNPGTYGSVSYPYYSIGRQPETRTAPRRCTTVTGSIVFRGASHSSTTTICQAALGGGWNSYEGRHYTGVSVYPTTSSSFGCDGGNFSISSTGYFYDRYEWRDDCGTVYHSSPYDDRSGSESAGGDSSSFGSCDCCIGGCSNSRTLSVSYHGLSNSYTFYQSCPDCSSDPSCDPGPGPCEGVSYNITPSRQVDCHGGSVTFTAS